MADERHDQFVDASSQALGRIQQARFAELTGIDVESLADRTLDDLNDRFKLLVDPPWFAFRRVCGRVVKRDPATGDDWGVPGATVHVYDTDLGLFGWFPPNWPYGWWWPFHSHREQIATAKTDACGNFCVWIPRFDIDYVWRWRIERRCYPELFHRPTIRDLLDRLRPQIEVPPRPPGPGPDPGLLDFLDVGIEPERVLNRALGRPVADRLLADRKRGLGERLGHDDQLLDQSAFRDPIVPPPLPPELSEELRGLLDDLDPDKFELLAGPRAPGELVHRIPWIGPFWRCRDVIVPQIMKIVDVPDITFGVTQDIDNDGAEETIYSEGFFDVRWDAGPLPPVVLHARPEAIAVATCVSSPDLGPCAEPELILVGNMPLKNPVGPGTYPIVDPNSGYAVRPNRPHPTGRVNENPTATIDAASPVAGLLDFWGCAAHTSDGQPADRYRILQRISTDGLTFGPQHPIYDSWLNWRTVGIPSVLEWKAATQDAEGWWEVLNPADNWQPGEGHLLQWHDAPNGQLELTLEIGHTAGGGAVNVLETATPVLIRVDHAAPRGGIARIWWRTLPGGPPELLADNCPVIHRAGQDLEFVVELDTWSDHLQSVSVDAGGCGGGAPELIAGLEAIEGPGQSPISTYWHKGPGDNHVFYSLTYQIPNGMSDGVYSFSVRTNSRAFYPNDGHVFDPTNPDTGYNIAPIWMQDYRNFAVVQ